MASVAQTAKSKTITLVIAGVNGRMGRATMAAIHKDDAIKLVGAFGRREASYAGKNVQDLGVTLKNGKEVLVSNDLDSCLAGLSSKPDVLIDFTEAESAVKHAIAALEKDIRPVIGATGLTEEHLKELRQACTKAKIGAMVAPNFSVGIALLIGFARQASKFFKSTEIVETHKLGKLDAPSGTAMYTAWAIGEEGAKINQTFNENPIKEHELIAGARGGKLDSGIHVHSLRLPGILSKQDVYFAGEGELLTLRHESHNTKCFEQGIVLAIKSVNERNSFVLGLDSIIEQFTG